MTSELALGGARLDAERLEQLFLRYPQVGLGLSRVLAARNRDVAAPTFAADGLYFAGPYYDAALGLPALQRLRARVERIDRHDLGAPR